jgi:hypothetical protein
VWNPLVVSPAQKKDLIMNVDQSAEDRVQSGPELLVYLKSKLCIFVNEGNHNYLQVGGPCGAVCGQCTLRRSVNRNSPPGLMPNCLSLS